MKWMGAAHNNVNANISLAQFSFNVQLMDSYSTDYYETNSAVYWGSASGYASGDRTDLPTAGCQIGCYVRWYALSWSH